MSNSLGRFWEQYRHARGVSAELLTLALCLIAGLIVVPCLIWLVGRAALGPYSHGGLFSLWRDFLQGLAAGSVAFWTIALGPYCFLCLLRGARWLFGART